MHYMRPHALVTVLAILFAAAGCSGGGGYAAGPGSGNTGTTGTKTNVPAAGTPNSVVITNNEFTPATLSTTVGATVTWTWNSCSGVGGYGGGETCVSHSVTFDQGTSNSVTQGSGTFSRTFTVAGTYPYHCAVHGAAMSGQVVVQ